MLWLVFVNTHPTALGCFVTSFYTVVYTTLIYSHLDSKFFLVFWGFFCCKVLSPDLKGKHKPVIHILFKERRNLFWQPIKRREILKETQRVHKKTTIL